MEKIKSFQVDTGIDPDQIPIINKRGGITVFPTTFNQNDLITKGAVEKMLDTQQTNNRVMWLVMLKGGQFGSEVIPVACNLKNVSISVQADCVVGVVLNGQCVHLTSFAGEFSGSGKLLTTDTLEFVYGPSLPVNTYVIIGGDSVLGD